MLYKRLDFNQRASQNYRLGNNKEFLRLNFCAKNKHYIIERDILGIIPCYVLKDLTGTWFVSSNVEKIKNKCLGLNHQWLSKIKNLNFSDQINTAFTNMWRIPPGSKATLNGKSIVIDSTTEIFDLELYDNNCSEKAWLSLGRELIKNSVESRCKRSAVLCSGGFDSNFISQIVSEDTPLLCLDFDKPPEKDYLGLSLLKELEAQRAEIHLAESYPTDEFKYHQHRDPGVIAYSPNLWIFRPLLKRAHDLGCEQVFTGLGGDDLFHPAGDIRGSLNYRLFYSGLYSFGIEQEQELAQSFGLLMSYPLLDLELVRYVLSSPKVLIKKPYRNKSLLRSLAKKYLPEHHIKRISNQDYSKWRSRIIHSQKSGVSFDDWIVDHYTNRCKQLLRENVLEKEKESLQETDYKENWKPTGAEPNH